MLICKVWALQTIDASCVVCDCAAVSVFVCVNHIINSYVTLRLLGEGPDVPAVVKARNWVSGHL